MQEKSLKYRALFITGCIFGAASLTLIFLLINAINKAQLITPPVQVCSDSNIPRAAYIALLYYQHNKQAPASFIAIKTFEKRESEEIPRQDQAGNKIIYVESDIFPYLSEINRGLQRIIIGSDGSAYYTPNHYKTFVQITPACVIWFSRNAKNM